MALNTIDGNKKPAHAGRMSRVSLGRLDKTTSRMCLTGLRITTCARQSLCCTSVAFRRHFHILFRFNNRREIEARTIP